ncbi:MAG: UvrD-helicase domain-containing protein [Prevotella sp.]
MTLTDFLKAPKGLLIAPAGHGKTHTIGNCVKLCPDDSVQLILTHTHAGIASLRAKFKKLGISNNKYKLETISGFAQRLVFAYVHKDEIPEQEEKGYFDFIIKKSIDLLSLVSVQVVVKNSFQGVFVDEYQDCTLDQHQMIMRLADLMPAHILGDELQGIFSFAGRKVEFNKELADFEHFDFLTEPWRWKLNGNCEKLGHKIIHIRERLLSYRTSFTLVHDEDAHFFVNEYNTIDNRYYTIRKCIDNLKDNSILLITPTYKDLETGRLRGGIIDRADMRKRIGIEHSFTLLEAIDDKSFYSVSKDVDDLINGISRSRRKIYKIYEVLTKFTFNVTELKEWIEPQKNYIKQKRDKNKELSKGLEECCNTFINNSTMTNFYSIFNFFYKTLHLRPKRPELLHSLAVCMKNAVSNGISVYDNMVEYKNRIRQIGRKVEGRCMGTTLLTKGLEFDTVVIVDAHLFSDKKNFYVAISRACKNVVILTESKRITLK